MSTRSHGQVHCNQITDRVTWDLAECLHDMRHPPFWSLAHLDIWHRTGSNPYFPYWNDVSFCRGTVELQHGWQQLELLLLTLKLVSLCWFHPLLHFTILSQCIGRRPEGFEPSSRLLIECRRLSDPRYPRKLILLAFIARLFPGLFLGFSILRGLHIPVTCSIIVWL